VTAPIPPHRLLLDGEALVANWHALAKLSRRAACGAAVKADGYGLGAREVVRRLAAAGARDFFVATWAEARAVADLAPAVSVLHGVRAEDMGAVRPANVRPVLNTPAQLTRWREAGGGPCDVMVDTGMNRLGLSPEEAVALTGGLQVQTLMSHLACADEDSSMNEAQRAAFAALGGRTSARRMSLANSAATALGEGYAFDITRPGLALYGGVPRSELAGLIRPVVRIEAQVLQRRRVSAGGIVGYNAVWTAERDTGVAILNLGYADGYRRAFSNIGEAWAGDRRLPVIGRVSMDLIAVDVTDVGVGEGDWVDVGYRLDAASAASGASQYELLTGLGARLPRVWR
jgi:alanine racemase